MSIAVCCELATDEINKPKAKALIVKNKHSPTNKAKLPCMGTSKTKTLSNKMLTMFTDEKIGRAHV